MKIACRKIGGVSPTLVEHGVVPADTVATLTSDVSSGMFLFAASSSYTGAQDRLATWLIADGTITELYRGVFPVDYISIVGNRIQIGSVGANKPYQLLQLSD